MSDINLIVPPIFETEATGFRIAGEKTIRGTLWRVECWRGELYPRVYKNGKRLASIFTCPDYVAGLANQVSAMVPA